VTDVPRARNDYRKFLEEMNLTEEQAQEMVNNPLDQINLTYDDLERKPSLIHGEGVFVKRLYDAGEPIGFARISRMRSVLGRYVNHSPDYNAILVDVSRGPFGDLLMVTSREIRTGEEILIDYRQAQRVR
jgi:SET domain-containing protein